MKVVCVHGVGQQRETAETLHQRWAPALCGGIGLAHGELSPDSVRCAHYGDLFRPAGRKLGPSDPLLRPDDLDDVEQAMLAEWWREAARVDPAVVDPEARTLARTPQSAQRALRALSGSSFFSGLTERALLGNLRQLRQYFREPDIRRAARQRVLDALDDDVRVVVGHSLGSIVAYETLCAHPELPVRHLVTLGSPLGVDELVFSRLEPAPGARGEADGRPRGRWPGPGRTWTNIADAGDVVALVKDLRPVFGPGVECWLIDNGAHAHDVRPYLTARETGAAVLNALRAV